MKLIVIPILTILTSFYSSAIETNLDSVILKKMKQEKRVALVIGNSKYQQKKQKPFTLLSNTINDARAIRTILLNRGFDVIYGEDVSYKDFNNILEKFYQNLGTGGVGLFYFSGHGMELDGQNYLIPIDAYTTQKSDVKYVAIALNKIIDRIKQIEKTRLNIVILDACRNDPYAKGNGIGGLAKTEPIGLFVAYATGAGQVSSDGKVGGHGLFTQYLIENMKKPLNLQTVFRNTRTSVFEASEGTQFPAIYDQVIKGEFYFTLPSNHIQPTPVADNTLQYTPIFKVYSQSDVNRQKPINASITIENKGLWQSGMKFKEGKYYLTISSKGYKTQRYSITIKNNQNFDFQLPLLIKKLQQPSSNYELMKQGKLIPHPTSERERWHNAQIKYDQRFSKNSTNTVKHHPTGLIWPKSLTKNPMNFNDAKKYCSNLSLDGYKNWRLPTIEELKSFIDEPMDVSAPNKKFFITDGTYSTYYWSSTVFKEGDRHSNMCISMGTNLHYLRGARFYSSHYNESTLQLRDRFKYTPLCVHQP